jgi:hemerythrin
MMTELGLLLDRVQDGSDAAVVRQVDFVNEWYLRHVDFSDRKFTNWLAR